MSCALPPTFISAIPSSQPLKKTFRNAEYNNIAMQTDEIEILGEITDIETIAIGNSIRNLDKLQKKHGRGRWRKLKGLAYVRLPDATTCFAEVHWYEASGIGKRDMKVKHILGK